MKFSTIKMRLVSLISGLALLTYFGLQSHAQTVQQNQTSEWGILVYNGVTRHFYSLRGEIFRGTKAQCEAKKAELERSSKSAPVDQNELQKKMNKTSQHATEEIQPNFSLEVTSEHIQKGNPVAQELHETLQLKYKVIIIKDHLSILLDNETYLKIANEWNQSGKPNQEFNSFVNKQYSDLCKQNNFNSNESDFYEFDKLLRSYLCTLSISQSDYTTLAKKFWDNHRDQTSYFSEFAKNEYNRLCNQYKCKFNNEDFKKFRVNLGNLYNKTYVHYVN